jgi:hypothetical protein
MTDCDDLAKTLIAAQMVATRQRGNDSEQAAPRRPKSILPTTYNDGIMKMAQ